MSKSIAPINDAKQMLLKTQDDTDEFWKLNHPKVQAKWNTVGVYSHIFFLSENSLAKQQVRCFPISNYYLSPWESTFEASRLKKHLIL